MNFNRKILVLLFTGTLAGPMLADDGLAEEQQLGTSSEVFASQGEVVLTQAELDAAFDKVPAELRLRFIRDGEKVDQLVANLLRTKLIAAEAIKAGYDTRQLSIIRMELAAETELAEAWVQNYIDNTPKAEYEKIAYELYLAKPENYMSDPTIDVSHILLSSSIHGDTEALQLAQQLREEIIADPARFDALVMEYSDDPSKNSNAGRFPDTSRGQMVKPFEEAAFAMETPGEVSEPVRTNYGYHLIRLNSRQPAAVRPFEEVKAQSISNVQRKYKEEARVRYIKSLITEPVEINEEAVEAMAKRYFGEDLEGAPGTQR